MHAYPDCIFCKIAAGDIPAAKIFGDADTVAFLDIHPNSKGHTLVIPKWHSDNFLAADDAAAEAVMRTVRLVAAKLRSALGTEHMNIATNIGSEAGQVIFHTHVHIIPRYADKRSKGYTYAEGEMEGLAEKIRKI